MEAANLKQKKGEIIKRIVSDVIVIGAGKFIPR